MERMLSEDLKKDKSKTNKADESGVADSSSESAENSKHKRYLTEHWKELKAKKATASKNNAGHGIESISSSDSKYIESPP